MDLGLRFRRALIIGGTSGLGLAAAEALASEGADLVLFARGTTALESTAESLKQRFGIKIITVAGDITDPQSPQALAHAVEKAGGLDILVLNTPRPPSPMRSFLDETDDARWNTAYENQLRSSLAVLRALAPLIRDTAAQGRIIGITSASVKQPMARHAISTVFRAGVQAALKHLANELAPLGVTVNSVAPAGVSTPTFSEFHDAAARAAAMPLKRLGTLEEFGALVAFLASRQSGYITGQCIQFDGGLTGSLT